MLNGSHSNWPARYPHAGNYVSVLPNGDRQMIVADVIVGTWAQGEKGLDCPELPGGSGNRCVEKTVETAI